jgi:hypothetical protein
MRAMASDDMFVKVMALGFLIVLGACAGPSREPAFASVTLPPVPADKARIFFYRFSQPYESLALSPIYLNRREAAVSVPGEVSTLDVAPADYELYVYSRNDFSNSFKRVALRSGDALYVRVDALKNWGGDCFAEWPTFVSTLVPEEQARAEMAGLRYNEGHRS